MSDDIVARLTTPSERRAVGNMERERDFWRDLAVSWMRRYHSLEFKHKELQYLDSFISTPPPSSLRHEEDDATIVDRLMALNHPDAADAADIIELLRAENDALRKRQ